MIQRGGRQIVGFGDSPIDRIERAQDPLYESHHDTYVKLQMAGSAIASALLTAAIIHFAQMRAIR